MYEGNNKAALISQKLLEEAMLRLLETMPFPEISVSILCREAQVSRQTFYSLFGTKENVIVHILQNSCCFSPTESRKSCRSASFRDFCRGYSSYIIENDHIIGLLVKNDMMHFLYDVQYESFMACRHFFSGIIGEERVYLVDFITSGMNSIAKNYVLSGRHGDKPYLEKLMFRLYGGYFFTSYSPEQ